MGLFPLIGKINPKYICNAMFDHFRCSKEGRGEGNLGENVLALSLKFQIAKTFYVAKFNMKFSVSNTLLKSKIF